MCVDLSDPERGPALLSKAAKKTPEPPEKMVWFEAVTDWIEKFERPEGTKDCSHLIALRLVTLATRGDPRGTPHPHTTTEPFV